MRIKSPVLAGALLTTLSFSGLSALHVNRAQADPPATAAKEGDAVATLYKQATDAYARLNSYQHTEIYSLARQTPQGERKRSEKFMLALERPNKFLFKSEDPKSDAAVSDGKTLINYHDETREYMKTPAPATYKGIDLVKDVMFRPQATYLVALALQGDMMADKDMAAIFKQAKMGEKVQEEGKTYQTAVIKAGDEATMTLYFDADTHLLHKLVQEMISAKATITEQFENVQINKPVDASVVTYAPPEGSKKVDKFTDPNAEAEAAMKALAAKYEGKPAGDFTVLERGGKEVKLSAMKGKIVVVDFWASWCGPCKMVMPTIQEIHDKYKGKGVTVMAVDTWDAKMACEDFLTHNPKYTMPVLLDPAGKDGENSIATKKYGVEGIPTTLFIDKTGVVRKYAIGAHPREFYIDTLKEMGVPVSAAK